MDGKNIYSQEAWDSIRALPYLIAMGVEGAGGSGFLGSTKERAAAARSIGIAGRDFSESALVMEVCPGLDDESLIMEKVNATHDVYMERLREKGIQTSAELVEFIIEEVKKVWIVLKAHESTEEINAFGSWLYKIADNVAKAAKEGDFMGIGGKRVSEGEIDFCRRIRNAMELPPLS